MVQRHLRLPKSAFLYCKEQPIKRDRLSTRAAGSPPLFPFPYIFSSPLGHSTCMFPREFKLSVSQIELSFRLKSFLPFVCKNIILLSTHQLHLKSRITPGSSLTLSFHTQRVSNPVDFSSFNIFCIYFPPSLLQLFWFWSLLLFSWVTAVSFILIFHFPDSSVSAHSSHITCVLHL